MLVYCCGCYEPLEIPPSVALKIDQRSKAKRFRNATDGSDSDGVGSSKVERIPKTTTKSSKAKKNAKDVVKDRPKRTAAVATAAAASSTSTTLSLSALTALAKAGHAKVVAILSTEPPYPVQTPSPPLSTAKCAVALSIISVFGTPLMMVAMGPFQLHQLRLDFAEIAITQMPGKFLCCASVWHKPLV